MSHNDANDAVAEAVGTRPANAASPNDAVKE